MEDGIWSKFFYLLYWYGNSVNEVGFGMFCYCYWLLVLGVEVWLVLFGGFYMGVVGFVIVNVVYVDGIFICSFLVIIC